MYSLDTSTTQNVSSLGQTAQILPQSKEVVTVNNSAWGSLGAAEPEREEANDDNLWSSFQSQQQQQTQLEKEREEREVRLRESREQEALQLAESAKRRQAEEAEIAQRQKLQAEEEEQRRLEEERERARQMRQQAAVVDLGEQRSLMDDMMNTYG